MARALSTVDVGHARHSGRNGERMAGRQPRPKAGWISKLRKELARVGLDPGRMKPSNGVPLSSSKAAAIVLAVLATAVLVAGCSSSTPNGTVRDFIKERVAGRDERAAELTLEGDLSGYPGGENHLAGSDMSLSAEVSELAGDRAVVLVRFRLPEGELEVPYVCRREGARWKVSLRETEELWYPDTHESEGE